MAWFLNGDWDCLTTPPGADVNDLPTIMEQIARAINERLGIPGTQASGGGVPPKWQWKYTDALDVSAEFPTAAQFAGIRIDGACVKQFLLDCEDILTYANGNMQGWYQSDGQTAINVWTASASAGVFDINKPATYAPNWLRIKAAIELMRFYRVRGTFDIDKVGGSIGGSGSINTDINNFIAAGMLPATPWIDGQTHPLADFIDAIPDTGNAPSWVRASITNGANSVFVLRSASASISIPAYVGTPSGTHYVRANFDMQPLVNQSETGAATINPVITSTIGGVSITADQHVVDNSLLTAGATVVMAASLDTGASGSFTLQMAHPTLPDLGNMLHSFLADSEIVIGHNWPEFCLIRESTSGVFDPDNSGALHMLIDIQPALTIA